MVKDLQNVSSVVSEDVQINALNSIEQLIELDATLNDSAIFSKWVSQIAKIGGVNLKDNVKRVIERLLTIELRCLLNMKGQTNSTNKTKQKLAFSKTKLYRVLVESVSKRYPDEAGIYEAVKSILKYSPINFCRKQKLKI
ncbi:uncharacterized protein LOC124817970 isoform X2 [Hydra vulgaris]|uniref:uncharacterized protein LOC124817970 isoform X2 n=1 Tax=Hydra vulgaris TaxID=6087 RepID=UPI001F5F46E1|nr:uncharacterized protein LOC124817970 [Hydra vulgaris]